MEIRLTSVEISQFLSGWLLSDNGNVLFECVLIYLCSATTIVFRLLVRSKRLLRNRVVTGHLVIEQLMKSELELA